MPITTVNKDSLLSRFEQYIKAAWEFLGVQSEIVSERARLSPDKISDLVSLGKL